MQQVTDLKKKSKYIKFTSLNENILHTCVNIDEYAGVIEREEKRQKDEINAHLAMDHGNLSEAVDALEKVDPYMDDKVIELAKKLVDEEGISEESNGENGIYLVTCGNWEKIADVTDEMVNGTTVDLTDNIIVQNDIDFCECGGVFHIDYYLLTPSCYMHHLQRTVKVMCAADYKLVQFLITHGVAVALLVLLAFVFRIFC